MTGLTVSVTGPDTPTRGVRSLPVSIQSRFLMTGRVCSSMTGRRQSLVLSSLAHRPMSAATGHTPCASGPSSLPASDQRTESSLHRDLLTGHTRPSSVTTEAASGHLETASPLLKLRHPCSNVLTTKCITLCTCVSNFSQTFLRVLALTRI
jgi:hypothetical protein